MRTRIRTKTVVCGDFLHVYSMPYIAPHGNTRQKRFKPTRESMIIYNKQRAEKWLEELAETNFDDKDYYFTFTYHDNFMPQTDEAAEHQAVLYVRRLQYHCKKNNKPDPVIIWDIEKTKKGRYHHHMMIKSDLPVDYIKKLWGKGYINYRQLEFDETGLAGLSKYILKSKTHIGVRRWHSTHNLKKPIQFESNQMSKKQYTELAINLEQSEYFKNKYPDYFLNRDSVKLYRNEINGFDYMYFKLYRKDSIYINSFLFSSRACKLDSYRKKKSNRPTPSRPLNPDINLQ